MYQDYTTCDSVICVFSPPSLFWKKHCISWKCFLIKHSHRLRCHFLVIQYKWITWIFCHSGCREVWFLPSDLIQCDLLSQLRSPAFHTLCKYMPFCSDRCLKDDFHFSASWTLLWLQVHQDRLRNHWELSLIFLSLVLVRVSYQKMFARWALGLFFSFLVIDHFDLPFPPTLFRQVLRQTHQLKFFGNCKEGVEIFVEDFCLSMIEKVDDGWKVTRFYPPHINQRMGMFVFGKECFKEWTWGGQDHLVNLNLVTILVNQVHISKIFIFP